MSPPTQPQWVSLWLQCPGLLCSDFPSSLWTLCIWEGEEGIKG